MNIKITYGEHTKDAKERCYDYILKKMKNQLRTEKEHKLTNK